MILPNPAWRRLEMLDMVPAQAVTSVKDQACLRLDKIPVEGVMVGEDDYRFGRIDFLNARIHHHHPGIDLAGIHVRIGDSDVGPQGWRRSTTRAAGDSRASPTFRL